MNTRLKQERRRRTSASAAVAVDDEADEHRRNPFVDNFSSSSPKLLQFRKDVSKAQWDKAVGMAEVTEMKGSLWVTTGIIRDAKLYCNIEETLYLAERGALTLLDGDEDVSMNDMYKKVAREEHGCSWKSFEAYRHLKKLGFIVARHGIPWSKKTDRGFERNDANKDGVSEEETLIINYLNDLQINGWKPAFDVYLPDSKFRKSSPGDPSFVLFLGGEYPPSRMEIENLSKRCRAIPLKFCCIDHGRVCFFSFDKSELPILP